ncbi:unnamed protein product [Phytophthora fragariaefolia]|uniref:Unnamed protein product n=1 Tax=Phytophthora fragariaefolia TaxID=1490495 RepID=A0A9W7D2J5_9STRA|nr:unnamed protein product [Phytophthora fragariaefolia]
MHDHRTLSFAWIDSTHLKLSLENMLPDAARRGQHRVVLFRRQRDPDTRKKVLAAKAYRDDVFDAVSVRAFLDDHSGTDSLKKLAKSPKILHRKKKSKSPHSERDNGNKRPRRGHHHRRKNRDTEEKGDDYYFPQHVENDEDEDASSIVSDDVEVEEDVLDLDDENDAE